MTSSVAPAAKVVFVSSILTAAEAELAEAVVERSDVLASLGPVLVHLCTPGRVNARRSMTESFDRPDWIDRVRKDPLTLREILSEHGGEVDDAPSVTSLQGEARAAVPEPDEDLVVLPDLEAAGPEVEPVDAATTPSKRRRRRWLGIWTLALATAGLLGAGPPGPSRRRGY